MSSTYDGTTVPPGQSPPFARVTPDDHTAWIVIATALGMACFLFFGGVRVLVRWTISHGFGPDDYVLCAATIFAIIQSSIIFGACAKGLGKSVNILSDEAQVEVQKMYYTSNLFFILAIGAGKASVIFFLSRISRMKQHRIVFNIANAVILAWTVASIFALAIQCDSAHPWISIGEDCSGAVRHTRCHFSQSHNTDEYSGAAMAGHQFP